MAVILLMTGRSVAETIETSKAHFDLTVSGPSAVKSGDDINVNVDIANNSSKSIDGILQHTGNPALDNNRFYVRGPLSGPTPRNTKKEFEKTLSALSTFSLSPGESIREDGTLSHAFLMTIPGRYNVQIRNRLDDGSFVTSNTITIVVSP